MTRKTLAALKVEIAALLPDNTAGEISPADLRTVLDNAIDSLNTVVAMSYGSPNVTFATTATVQKLPANFFTAVINDDITVLEGRAGAAGDLIARSNVGQLQVAFDVSLSGGNNVQYDFRVLRNGVALPPIFRESTQGAGNPVTIAGSWLIDNPAVDDVFTIGISTPDGNSSPTIAGCAIKGAMFPTAV